MNKALIMDQQHNSRDEMNTSGGSEYLTLKKFGWTEHQSDEKQQSHRPQKTLLKQQATTSKSILTNGASRNSSRRSSFQNNNKENSNPASNGFNFFDLFRF